MNVTTLERSFDFDSRRNRYTWIMLAVTAIALDQGAKFMMNALMTLGERIEVTPWFNLVLVLNPGAAFSFLADAGGWQRYFLSGLGIVVAIALSILIWRGVHSRLVTVAYVGLIGGAMGNVMDRLRIGAVVDYLDLHWNDVHWPAFNLADVFVVGSAGMLMLSSFRPVSSAERSVQGEDGQAAE